MKSLLATFILIASAACAFGRAAALDPARAAEDADVIARIRVRRIMPAPGETGFGHMAQVAVGTAIKGVKRGEILYFLGDNGMLCPNYGFNWSGDYIVYARKLPTGQFVPLGAAALIDAGPGQPDALKTIQEIRLRLAAVEEAKREATRLYPELARSDSKLNALFLARYKARLQEWSNFFHDTNWPITLAKQCAYALKPADR